jgi:hypothetical protein
LVSVQQRVQELELLLSQTKATNNQLKTENNRLSATTHSPTRKCHHAPVIEALELEAIELRNENLELRANAREADTAKLNLKRALSILPSTTNIRELEQEIQLLQATERNANNRAEALAAALEDWEAVGKLLAPASEHPFEAAQQAQTLLKDNTDLHNKLRRLSQTAFEQSARSPNDTMAGASTSGMFSGNLSSDNCHTLWNSLPEATRQHFNIPQPDTSVDLITALSRILIPLDTHPAEAANALNLEPNTPWDTSLDIMLNHAAHECPEEHGGSSSRLFKVSDVPRFTSVREYASYRSQLCDFFLNEDSPKRADFAKALTRITSAFDDPHAKMAKQAWNLRNICHPTSWELTTQEFLKAMDEKFESQTILQDTKIAWMACKPRPDEKPNEFFTRFEAATAQYQAIAKRKGTPVVSDAVMVERLLTILPHYLTNNARDSLILSDKVMENMSFVELRKFFEVKWTYLPRPAAKGHDTKTNFNTAATRSSPASFAPKEPKTYACGFHGNYETVPSVPQKFRGSIFSDPRKPAENAENEARKRRCAAEPLCINCRRPRDQHQTMGANFKPITLSASTRNAPAAPTGQLTITDSPEIEELD